MASVNVPSKLMLNKLSKSNMWHQLGLNDWINQIGLIRLINKTNGMGSYYIREKGDYKLWEFILYVDSVTIPAICEYFEFPEDIRQFLSFCFNEVAADLSWKEKSDKEQMDYFPYEHLHTWVWEKQIKKVADTTNI